MGPSMMFNIWNYYPVEEELPVSQHTGRQRLVSYVHTESS